MTIKPTKHNSTAFHQLCKLIPVGMVRSLAKEHGVDKKSRLFTPWSHVVALLFSQFTHAISLNDICDTLKHHGSKLMAIRGARAPSRNGLSHANKERKSKMMESLFWKMQEHLLKQFPDFYGYGRYRAMPHRFKRAIHSIDSSTIALVANCIDWAKHRRRKAAAKLQLRLNLQSFLPSFVIVEEASHHDSARMIELCSGLQEGEIVVFDKAYVAFKKLFELGDRGLFWVTRAKDNMVYTVCKKNIKKAKGNLLRDDIIVLKGKSKKEYPIRMRRICAMVEINGKMTEMVFLTNNMEWTASSVCDLYRCRWGIEVFFKQLKQTLKVCDFLGHSKQAIQWQLWSALLLYLLLRFLAFKSKWTHSFSRLFTVCRGVCWDRYDLYDLLGYYGTAGKKYRMCSHPETAYLPGFEPEPYGTA